MAEHLSGRLTFRYGIVLGLLGLLALVESVLLDSVITTNAQSAAAVNIAGRQRMLSQRIAFFSQRIAVSSDVAERAGSRAALLAAVNLLERSHRALREGDANVGLSKPVSAEVRSNLFEGRGGLDEQVGAFIAHVRRLTTKPDGTLSMGDPDLAYVLNVAPSTLVFALDAMTRSLQEESEEKVSLLRKGQMTALLLTLAMLALSAWGVFRPMVRQIQNDVNQLEAAEKRIRSILNSANDGILVFDQTGKIELFNPAVEYLLGVSDGGLEGRTIHSLLCPEGAEQLDGVLRGSGARLGASWETAVCRIDGARVPVELSTSRLDIDRRTAFIVVLHDLTEQKKSQEELHLAATVFGNSLHAVTITDAQGRILNVNRAFTATTGYGREEAMGQNPSLLSSGRHDPAFYKTMWDSILATGRWEGEIWNKRKNGEIYPQYLEINAVHGASGEITNYVGFFTDITRIKAADQRLTEYAAELEKANVDLRRAVSEAHAANRAKSEFLAVMSHELRTPLNAVIGFSEAMLMGIFGPVGDTRYQGYLTGIRDSGSHLLSVINDVLDMSKVEAGALEILEEEVDVAETVAAAVRIMTDRARKEGISLVVEMPSDLSHLLADERRVRQILLNLLSNSIKFTPRGGQVVVRAASGVEGLRVSVEDSGIGIAAKDIPKALSPFGQVDSRLARKYEGTGLGLPLTKSLVELHGGTLELESTVDVGTTVYVKFPAGRLLPAGGQVLAPSA